MSRLMPPENRRAVVLFLRGPVAERVDAIRRHWDPVMTGRIDAHVTLVHQATDHAAVEQRVAELEAPAWSRVAFRPHVTLVHGRTVDPALAGPAWTALCDQRAGWSAPLTA